MHRNPSRPMSPHLTIWKWGPHMLVSILHRVTGSGLAVVGLAAMTWWLVAIASGAEAYETFMTWAKWWPGMVVFIGLVWAFWQHLFSGLRHFVMDLGAGYELRTNRLWAVMTIVAGLAMTGATVGWVLWGRGL